MNSLVHYRADNFCLQMNTGRVRQIIGARFKQAFTRFATNNRAFHTRARRLLWTGQAKTSSRRLVCLATPGVLLSLTWTATLKDVLGVEKVKLDKDPIKDKIKRAMYFSKHQQYDEAIQALKEAMEEAKRQSPINEAAITYITTELANVYFEMGVLDRAETLYREAIIRQIRIHGRNEMSPEFIQLSLRLSDVFSHKGDLENAEIGYRHCVSKQMEVMDNHLKGYLVSKGALIEERHPVDIFGHKYTDPIALFGMALEDYSHFLVEHHSSSEERMKEASDYIEEMIKISHHIFGGYAPPLMVSLNNFAARCISKNKFEMAKKYLSVGIDRVLKIDECAPILVNYYVNYAESLFHCGQVKEAMEYAKQAEMLAQNREPSVKNYAEKFRRSLERDARKQGYSEDSGWRSWLPF